MDERRTQRDGTRDPAQLGWRRLVSRRSCWRRGARSAGAKRVAVQLVLALLYAIFACWPASELGSYGAVVALDSGDSDSSKAPHSRQLVRGAGALEGAETVAQGEDLTGSPPSRAWRFPAALCLGRPTTVSAPAYAGVLLLRPGSPRSPPRLEGERTGVSRAQIN